MASMMRCRCCGDKCQGTYCQWCSDECGTGRDGCTKTFFVPVED